jgi:hypothetical protein
VRDKSIDRAVTAFFEMRLFMIYLLMGSLFCREVRGSLTGKEFNVWPGR